MTLGGLARAVARRLRAARLHYGHGTANARDEAAFLVLRGLGLAFEAPADRLVTPREAARVERLLQHRIRERMPVAYLLKEAWLADRRFYIDRRAIIPRSHIAFLLPALGKPARVLDLCTGSGCLAILAAQAFPCARIDAADLSRGALAVARRNIALHGLRGRVRLIKSDLMSALGARRYDLIVCNPPYVDRPSMRALPREYRHEPRLALAGGKEGLDLVHRILRQARAHLRPRGILLCEVGRGRRVLERAYRGIPFAWPGNQVFLLRREQLPRGEDVG